MSTSLVRPMWKWELKLFFRALLTKKELFGAKIRRGDQAVGFELEQANAMPRTVIHISCCT